MKYLYNTVKILVGFSILVGLISCNPEKQLAIDFTYKSVNKNILILTPDYIYKSSLKTYMLDSIEFNKNDNKDSILLVNSDYLHKLNDSLFLANYVLGYAKTLSSFGFRIYSQNQIEDFMTLDSNTYQINIAQIELEETLYTYRDEIEYNDSYYFHDHNLNAVYVNTWFEFSNTNEVTNKQQVYFTTDMITDIPDGTFDYDIFNGKVRYMYNIDSLQVNALYTFAYRIGAEYARYTFDLLLNKDLDAKIPTEQRSETYWRYDPSYHTFYPATDDRFILLDD